MSPQNNNHNNLLHHTLPIDELIRAGRELEDLEKVKDFAKGIARALRTDPYDSTRNPDDKLKEDDFQKDLRELADAELSVAHAGTNLKEGEHRAAELQKGLHEPKLSTRIVVTAISVIAVSLGPTLHDQFFSDMDDQVVAWLMAMSGGALVGAFLTWSIGAVSNPSGQRSLLNLAGLLGGLTAGVAGFFLRLNAGEPLIGVALTLLEFAAVFLVELHAAPLRVAYRAFLSDREAHSRQAAVVQSLNTESGRKNQHLDEIRQRVQNHKDYVAMRTYCAQKFAGIEEAAVQIATKAFLERQTEERRQQEQERRWRLGLG